MLVNLNDVLKKAQKEHYAVGLFNTTDTDMLDAAIGAAQELNCNRQIKPREEQNQNHRFNRWFAPPL